jgi:cytochrome c
LHCRQGATGGTIRDRKSLNSVARLTFVNATLCSRSTMHPRRFHTSHQEKTVKVIALLSAAIAAFAFTLPASAQDADAAQKVLKAENCTKCHSVDKTKKGPAYQKVAAKYKGKADAEAKLGEFLTSSPKVKLEDGTEEEHKALKDAKAMGNLIKWVLAQ